MVIFWEFFWSEKSDLELLEGFFSIKKGPIFQIKKIKIPYTQIFIIVCSRQVAKKYRMILKFFSHLYFGFNSQISGKTFFWGGMANWMMTSQNWKSKTHCFKIQIRSGFHFSPWIRVALGSSGESIIWMWRDLPPFF